MFVAVQEILGTQNLKYSDKLDLHGLYASEAVEATKEFVTYNIGRKKNVEIIIGTEKSKGSIMDCCKLEGWILEQHNHNNDESFIVHLPLK